MGFKPFQTSPGRDCIRKAFFHFNLVVFITKITVDISRRINGFKSFLPDFMDYLVMPQDQRPKLRGDALRVANAQIRIRGTNLFNAR